MSLESESFDRTTLEIAEWEGFGNQADNTIARTTEYVLIENPPYEIWLQTVTTATEQISKNNE